MPARIEKIEDREGPQQRLDSSGFSSYSNSPYASNASNAAAVIKKAGLGQDLIRFSEAVFPIRALPKKGAFHIAEPSIHGRKGSL